MSAPKFYAAVRPSGRIAFVATTKRHVTNAASGLWANGVNRCKYGNPAPPDWRRAKAAGWSVQGVTVRV